MNYLEEFIDTKNSSYAHQRDHCIKTLRDLKEDWNKSPDGGRLLQRKSGRMKRLDAELKQYLDETTRANKAAKRDSLMNEINSLVATQEDYTQQISKLAKSLKDTSSRLNVLTKSR